MVDTWSKQMTNKTHILMNSKYGNAYKQQGVVLVVSLVFLVALTAVAAALMQNTTSDMKMSGASEEKVIAVQQAISAVDEIVFNQVSPGKTNEFAAAIITFKDGKKILTAEMPKLWDSNKFDPPELDVTNNDYMLEAGCPHSKVASSTKVFSCNLLKVQLNRKYGRENTSMVNVNSGIAQQLLK
jgi:type IV pilus assembly protein PilX